MDIKAKILELKSKKEAVFLVHNYQIPEIQDMADFLGDSLELAKKSRNVEKEIIVFCGVKFMAETVKILSPYKKVILPVPEAGCPLADMIEPQDLIKLRERYPDAWVVSYVNSSAQVKALSDVCCTSSNAVTVVKNVPAKRVIFVPDKNLGWWVQKNIPEKEIILWSGYCFVHEYFSLEDLKEVRRLHPDAEVLVHPECRKEVIEGADFILSTAAILKRAKTSKCMKFVIGTEEGIIYRLKKENPQKTFYSLGSAKVCINMKMITLERLHKALEKEQFKIELDSGVIDKAKIALERMVEYV